MARKNISRVLSGGVIVLCIVLFCTPDISAQGFVPKKLTYSISGSVGQSGVVMRGLPGDPVTDASGNYSAIVDWGWSGKVTPTKTGYTFTPESRPYDKVTSNQANQDYTAAPIKFTISGTTGVGGVVMRGLPGDPVTDANGYYTATVDYNWSATVVPAKTGYTFNPPSKTYANVVANKANEDYIAALITFTISGTTGVDGVVMKGLPGDPVTANGGIYSTTVAFGWSGTVTPTKLGYTFEPPTKQYTDLTGALANQNYVGKLLTFTISGTGGIAGAVMSGLPGNPVTDANGYYTVKVQWGWGGRVVPSKTGYTFEPPYRDYNDVTNDLSNQGYTPSPITLTISGTAGVPGVTMNGLPGNPVSGEGGLYTATVDFGFTSTVRPTKQGYVFTPPQNTYTSLTVDRTDENYKAALITFTISGTVGVEGVIMKGLPGDPVTSAAGAYSAIAPFGWGGTVTPAKEGYTFNPPKREYADLATTQANQNYVATLMKRTISGTIISDKGPVEGVLVSADGGVGSAVTDANGQYELLVDYNWAGTVRPTKTGHTIEPTVRKYEPVKVDQMYQGYTAVPIKLTISGVMTADGTPQGAPIEGVLITASNGGTSDTTDAEGKYSITVPYGWTGTITPTKDGFVFEPPSKKYTNVTTDIKDGVAVPPEPVDTGPTPADTGPRPTDIGPTPTHIGPTPTDIGPTPTDIGPTPTDIGPRPTDTGPKPPDTTIQPDQFDKTKELLQAEINKLREKVNELLQIYGPQPPVTTVDANRVSIPPVPGPLKGPLVSAIFVDKPIGEALDELASRSGVKIHTDGTVKGTVTCRIPNVPLERALQIVLMNTNYRFKEVPDSYLVYTPISNLFEDTPIRDALRDTAQMANVTIIPDESVTGLVTATLKEVTLDTALEMILAGTGYAVKKTPDYYLVGSVDPTQPAFPHVSETRCLRMNNLRGEDAAALVSSAFQNYLRADANTVCVTAPESLMNRIVADLEKIDQPPRHVLLDARIVVMERGDLLALGVEWGWPQMQVGVFGSDHHMGGTGEQYHGMWPWGVQIGYSSDGTFTDALLLTLNLLAENSELKILASPQVLAQDGKRAQIRVLTEEYYMMYPELAGAFYYTRAELQTIESGTTLTITPRIGDNNDITLELAVELSDSIPKGRGSELPVVTRRTAANTVSIQNGGTVALAGLTEAQTRVKKKKVPGLSNLPLFGPLFRNEETDRESREVAVFITAHLMPETGQLRRAPEPVPSVDRLGTELPGEQFEMTLRESLRSPPTEQPPIGPAREDEFKMRLRENLLRSTR
jgi:type II secretory pathway component GspD/PulD (secretin)